MRIIEEVKSAREIINILNMNAQLTSNLSGNSSGNSLNALVLDNPNKEQEQNTDKARDRYYDNTVDFQYICIKKEHFDVSMIYLKYMNLKKEKYIEIIYKSPSIFLDGLFFKTPPLNVSQLSIFTKDRIPFTSVISCVLDRIENAEFINILKSIDSYLSNYIVRHARDINIKMHEDENHYLNYETILKPWYHPNKKYGTGTGTGTHFREQIPYSIIAAGNKYGNSTKWEGHYMINFKSYLERPVLEALKQSILNKSINNNLLPNTPVLGNTLLPNTPVLVNTEKKYVITFNISNIYFSETSLTPLIKCNKCEEVI